MTDSDGSSVPAPAGPTRSPIFEASHGRRYQRQELLRDYQRRYKCRLVVICGGLEPFSVPLFEETLYDANPSEDLHVMLDTPGGDGETAIRLARQAQSRCRNLTVIVPNQAKSAGTLFVLGAHQMLLGPTSDLGPVDPQIPLPDGDWVAAKTVISAVKHAERRVRKHPEAYPVYLSLLEGVSALQVQQARDAIGRSNALVREALESCPTRSSGDVDELARNIAEVLIDVPQSHGATVSAGDADSLGLPVIHADPASAQWRLIWRLWAEYFVLPETIVYEGEQASHIF